MTALAATARTRREVRAHLAGHGLLKRRRLRSEVGEPATALRVRQALEELGPLFAGLAVYLGSRVDWLPARDCRLLAATSVDARALSSGEVAQAVSATGERQAADLFSAIASTPHRLGLIHQWNHAVLANGDDVVVKIVRPDAAARLDADLELLPVVEEMRFGDHWAALDLGAVVEDYLVWLERQLNLGREADALALLADEATRFAAFRTPRVHLARPRALVLGAPSGQPLYEILADGARQSRPELARRLALAWLEQSLLVNLCPEGPLVDHLTVLDEDRFTISGGLFTSLDPRWRRHLTELLRATARGEPDRACEALLAESLPAADEATRDELRVQMRQADPFRSEGWSDHFHGPRLGDLLFVYWRLARHAGVAPKPHHLSFLRGLAEVDGLCRQLDPHHDAVGDAVDDLRLVAAAVELREHWGPSRMWRMVPKVAGALEDLLVADHAPQPAPEPRTGRRGAGRLVAFAALATLLPALVLVAERVSGSFSGQRADVLLAAAFVATSLGLAWLAARSPRRQR